jgi:hypothetical protein
MTRLAKHITKATAHIESLRDRVEDEGRAYTEQQCPSCGRWTARFSGSPMADGTKSTFAECLSCRDRPLWSEFCDTPECECFMPGVPCTGEVDPWWEQNNAGKCRHGSQAESIKVAI